MPGYIAVNVPFTVAHHGRVQITVVDVLGRTVGWFDQVVQPGNHRFLWDTDASGVSLPSGTYWIRMQQGDETVVRPVTLVK